MSHRTELQMSKGQDGLRFVAGWDLAVETDTKMGFGVVNRGQAHGRQKHGESFQM